MYDVLIVMLASLAQGDRLLAYGIISAQGHQLNQADKNNLSTLINGFIINEMFEDNFAEYLAARHALDSLN